MDPFLIGFFVFVTNSSFQMSRVLLVLSIFLNLFVVPVFSFSSKVDLVDNFIGTGGNGYGCGGIPPGPQVWCLDDF